MKRKEFFKALIGLPIATKAIMAKEKPPEVKPEDVVIHHAGGIVERPDWKFIGVSAGVPIRDSHKLIFESDSVRELVMSDMAKASEELRREIERGLLYGVSTSCDGTGVDYEKK